MHSIALLSQAHFLGVKRHAAPKTDEWNYLIKKSIMVFTSLWLRKSIKTPICVYIVMNRIQFTHRNLLVSSSYHPPAGAKNEPKVAAACFRSWISSTACNYFDEFFSSFCSVWRIWWWCVFNHDKRIRINKSKFLQLWSFCDCNL